MGGAEAVRQVHKVVAVHPGLLKQLAGPGEVLAVQRQIFEDFLFKAIRVLAVKLLAERLALVQRDLLVADLLRGVVGRAANAVLDVGRVVEEVVDLVIDGVVLGVGALGALRRGAEAAVLDAVVVRALRMPLLVIAQIPHLNVVFLKVGSLGRQVDGQIGLVHFVVLLQLAQADTAQINMVVVVDRKEVLIAQGGVVVGNRVAELGLVLAVEHQRDAELRGHLGRQLLLAQNERLERVEQVLRRKAGQQAVGHAVGGAQVVVKARVDPRLHVLPAPGRVDVRGPGDGQRVHTVLVFQQVGGVEAVLAAGAGHKAVITAVVLAVLVAELAQLLLAQRPVDMAVGLVVAGMAGITDTVLLNDHRFLDGVDRVLKLIAGVGLLVAHDTFLAELYVPGQAVVGFELVLRDIGGVFAVINVHMAGNLFHILYTPIGSVSK